MAADLIPLIVITGPTASGKTAVALELAGKHGGEIICADSRTVYRGLDIGTAKPTAEERARVPHHLLDIVEPNRPYDLARFQCEARAAIADIRSRGKVPFLVGGSGLYIDSVVLDYELGPVPDKDRRRELEAMSLDELLYYSTQHNIKLPDNYHNKRYMVRAIEQAGINTRRQREPDKNTYVVAIATEDNELKERIRRRAVSMFEGDVLPETRRAVETYGEAVAPLQAPAYKAARLLLHVVITKNEAADMLARADWQLVRKQRTWLRRNPWTVWKTLDEAGPYVDSLLVRGGAASSQAEHERATIRES